MTSVKKTEDLSIFRKIRGNRGVDANHVKDLVKSYEENPYLPESNPILVNEKMEVIDGQHRLEALRQIGLPVYYYVQEGLDIHDVQILNSLSKKWSPIDFAKSFVARGNQNYVTYMEFLEKYKLTHKALLAVLSHSTAGKLDQAFKQGKFKVGDVKRANKIAEQLVEAGQFTKRGQKIAFVVAFIKVASTPGYNHELFISQLKKHAERILTNSSLVEDKMRELEEIYNSHLRDVNQRVRFF